MKRKLLKILGLAIVTTIASGSLSIMQVSAGSSDVVVDNTSFAEGINASDWNNANQDVVVEGGKIVFPKESTPDTRLITKLPAMVSDKHEELFATEYTMALKTLPKGEKFILAYSLANNESLSEEAGNLEIVFENNSGVKVAIYAYDDNGEQIVLSQPQACGVSIGSNFKVEVDATSEMKLTVKINNKVIYDEIAPIGLEGRIGLMQTGSCVCHFSSVNIVSHKYETPENCNIKEDFERGTINTNELTSKMINSCNHFPAGIHVEEYNGSQVMFFKNVGCGYLGTMHQYSNFELSFDVPYMLHSNVLTEDGNVLTPANFAFAVAFGDESADYDGYGYESAADALIFKSNEVSSMKYTGLSANFADKNFFDTTSTDGYSVKISMIDTMVTVEMKSLDATEYVEILSYKLGDSTPLGFIHFWSTGQANFAIDNLCITNKDQGAQLVSVDFKSGMIEGTDDWEYKPMEVKYRTDSENGGFNWYWVTGGAAVLGILIFAGCLLLGKRKAPKKGVNINEKI